MQENEIRFLNFNKLDGIFQGFYPNDIKFNKFINEKSVKINFDLTKELTDGNKNYIANISTFNDFDYSKILKIEDVYKYFINTYSEEYRKSIASDESYDMKNDTHINYNDPNIIEKLCKKVESLEKIILDAQKQIYKPTNGGENIDG